MDINRYVKWLKPPVFLLCLWPAASLGWGVYHDAHYPDNPLLGANPFAFIRNTTGTWTLIFICITLGVTPARRLFRQNWLVRFRRMLGQFAFFYGSLHLITYVWFDTGFDWPAIVKDVYMRPFITMGFTAWLLMVPLAITSTAGWVRRMGGKNWQKLHYLIYPTAIAAVLHYWWLVKADIAIPRRFAVIVGLLLVYRVVAYFLKKRKDDALAQARAAKSATVKASVAPKPAVSGVRSSSLSDPTDN